MMRRDDLVNTLADLLNVSAFDDYCPNGLQVEGRDEINTIIGGVTASQALIDTAIEKGADALIVHHGYFWKGEDSCVVGLKQKRLKSLLESGMNLFAYHLPLDAHPELGNNAQLAKLLGLTTAGSFGKGDGGPDIGLFGQLENPCTVEVFGQQISEKLGREPTMIAGGEGEIMTLAWCSGAAQGYLQQAAALGVDAYLTGEVSEQTVHEARELGIHFFSAGHHATERGGVNALGTYLAEQFKLNFEFVDINNPV